MASSEDSESEIKGDYLKTVHHHFGSNWEDFYIKDRARVDFYKKYPPPFLPIENSPRGRNLRIQAIKELSLDILEELNHLHISPSATHIQKVFNDNQFDIFRHMMRCVMTGYLITNT